MQDKEQRHKNYSGSDSNPTPISTPKAPFGIPLFNGKWLQLVRTTVTKVRLFTTQDHTLLDGQSSLSHMHTEIDSGCLSTTKLIMNASTTTLECSSVHFLQLGWNSMSSMPCIYAFS